jgi:hypothetical protein
VNTVSVIKVFLSEVKPEAVDNFGSVADDRKGSASDGGHIRAIGREVGLEGGAAEAGATHAGITRSEQNRNSASALLLELVTDTKRVLDFKLAKELIGKG